MLGSWVAVVGNKATSRPSGAVLAEALAAHRSDRCAGRLGTVLGWLGANTWASVAPSSRTWRRIRPASDTNGPRRMDRRSRARIALQGLAQAAVWRGELDVALAVARQAVAARDRCRRARGHRRQLRVPRRTRLEAAGDLRQAPEATTNARSVRGSTAPHCRACARKRGPSWPRRSSMLGRDPGRPAARPSFARAEVAAERRLHHRDDAPRPSPAVCAAEGTPEEAERLYRQRARTDRTDRLPAVADGHPAGLRELPHRDRDARPRHGHCSRKSARSSTRR